MSLQPSPMMPRLMSRRAAPACGYLAWSLRRPQLLLRTAVVLMLLLGTWPLTPRVAEAHPLGLTRIIVSFAPDHTYTIDIIVDPESLLAKLEILSGRAQSGLVPVSELPARIGALRETLLAQTHVIFDEQRRTPSFAYLPGPALPIAAQGVPGAQGAQGARGTEGAQVADARTETAAAAVSPTLAPATAPSAIVRLSGDVPAGAASFRLNYGLVLGSYAMTVRHGTPMSAESAVAAAVRAGAGTSVSLGAGAGAGIAAGASDGGSSSSIGTRARTDAAGVGVGVGVSADAGSRISAEARTAAATAGATAAERAFTDDAVTLWVAGGQDSERIDLTRGPLAVSRLAIAWQYFVLGFEHILPKGVDHILFVLGIFLLSTAWRPILLQVTTFTIAHSITLALTMYGIVSLPASIVEPLIALSITYVAIENLWTTELKPWRLALVFAFGLLHGMGFAGVLRELGLPRSEFVTALLTFNLGVEGGQLAVIGLALALVGWWRLNDAARYRQWVVVPASLVIALVGAYWTIARSIG